MFNVFIAFYIKSFKQSSLFKAENPLLFNTNALHYISKLRQMTFLFFGIAGAYVLESGGINKIILIKKSLTNSHS